MSAMLGRLQELVRQVWPFGAASDRQWVEPSSEITRSVMSGLADDAAGAVPPAHHVERAAAEPMAEATPAIDEAPAVREDDVPRGKTGHAA